VCGRCVRRVIQSKGSRDMVDGLSQAAVWWVCSSCHTVQRFSRCGRQLESGRCVLRVIQSKGSPDVVDSLSQAGVFFVSYSPKVLEMW